MGVTDSERPSGIIGPAGLLDYESFEQQLNATLQRCCLERKPISIAILAVDQFQQLAATHGSAVRDSAMDQVALRLRATLRQADILARRGDAQFVILMPKADRGGALIVAERARRALEETQFRAGDHYIAMSACFGVAGGVLGEGTAASVLLDRALDALSDAQNQGMNRIAVVDISA